MRFDGTLLPPHIHPDPAQSPRALLITGEQPMAEGLARLMHREGMCVHWAGTGALGLRLVEGVDPDVVLLDARMTGPDGSAVGPALRTRSGVPVIVVSVRADAAPGRDGPDEEAAAGADGQLAWPSAEQEVHDTVRRVLSGHREAPPVIDLRDEEPAFADIPRPRHAPMMTGHRRRRRSSRIGG